MMTFQITSFLKISLILFVLNISVAYSVTDIKRIKISSVFLSDTRIKEIKESVAQKHEPSYSAFGECLIVADQNLTRKPTAPKKWYVPSYYKDAEGHQKAKNGLRDDANAAYAMALCYRITGDSKYAESAIRLINAWANHLETMSREDDSMLSLSYHFPAFIFAADLLRDEGIWPKDEQDAFTLFLRNKALPMSTIDRENNWGNWGLVLSTSCAVYLKDQSLFRQCANRWKHFIEHQIADDGHLPHEVNRSGGQRGIWYSHFSLMPQTIAAEILYLNGQDLYDFKSQNGRTLKQAFERIAGWTNNPGSVQQSV